jgi:putative hemolysin
MSAIAVEVLTIVLLLVFNGLLAMSEIAVVASRRVRLKTLADEGSRAAQAALALLQEPTRFLSTVQVGITLIGILAGAFGGATIGAQLAVRLALVPGLAAYSEALALGLVVICITYLSLIIGELVPKRLAMQRPEAIAVLVARPLTLFARLAVPVVSLLSASTQLVLRLLRVRDVTESPVTEAEIRAVIEEGTEAGVLAPGEQEMMEGVLRLREARVGRVMTPRTDLEWIDLDDDSASIRAQLARPGRPRFLVCRGGVENVQGIVRVEDLLAQLLRNEPLDLTVVLRQVLFVPATTRGVDLLERFRRSNEDTALVLDEFGGIDGSVTIHDLVEEIVGDLQTLSSADQPAVQREDGSWLVDGGLAVADLADLLGGGHPSASGVQTLGGFVMTMLGHVPKVGEHFEDAGFRFEVMDMDGRRIDKVLVMRVPATPGSATA